MSENPFRGVLVPALTPFRSDLSPDADAFVTHCRWLLDRGADGLAVFGTTSEANSLGLDERLELLEHLIECGISPNMLMPGTGTSALTDTVRLTTHAVEKGCTGVLMLPPFYYKAVDDDGLFASYSEVIQRVGSDSLRIYLYHIPPVSKVPLSLELIGRLLKEYEGTVVGLKDSSGDWRNTEAVLKAYPSLATFCGSEVFLLNTMQAGGAGSITATANVNIVPIRRVYERWQEKEAGELQKKINAVRKTFEGYVTIPAMKAIIAQYYDSPQWRTVRPPLQAQHPNDTQLLRDSLTQLGFEM